MATQLVLDPERGWTHTMLRPDGVLRTRRAWFHDWSGYIDIEIYTPSVQQQMPSGWQEAAIRAAERKLASDDAPNGTVFLAMGDLAVS